MVECTVGVLFFRNETFLFKNRDLRNAIIDKKPLDFHATRQMRFLRGVNLQSHDIAGVSIGINRFGISVANTHVASSDDITYDVLCSWILEKASRQEDVAQIAQEFLAQHRSIQGGRILVAARHWALLVEVYRDIFMIAELNGARAITNHFTLIPARRSRLKAAPSSRRREAVANRLLAEVHSLATLKSFLRSHVPAKSATSICRHDENSNTESSHIIRIEDRNAQWMYLSGHPCENDYRAQGRIVISAPHAAGK